MSTVADVLSAVDRVAPLEKGASWDPVGLQLGDLRAQAQRIGVCHEVTDDVVDAVMDGDVDVVVSYHPLLFEATRRIVAGAGPAGRAFRLLRLGVSLVVVHTAADVTDGGCADALADALDLSEVTPFGPMWPHDSVKIATFVPADAIGAVRQSMSAAGAGVIGRYSACSFVLDGMGTFHAGGGANPTAGVAGAFNEEPERRIEMIAPVSRADAVVAALVAAHPYDEPAYDVFTTRSNAGFVGRVGSIDTTVADLAALIAERLDATPRVAGSGPVRRVAVVPGSGGSFIESAGAIADAIVTGDVSHHRARAALDRGLAVLDPGHAATERPGVASLYAALSTEIADAEVVDLTGIRVSPWEDG